MPEIKNDRLTNTTNSPPPESDEGGLRAPPGLTGWRKAWWWFHFLILVKLARLRFIGILLVIGILITQWDTLVAYYDRWTRPAETTASGAADVEYFCPMHPTVLRDNPKEKCPICFMPLSKRKKGSGVAEALPAGVVSRVQLTPYRVVLAGVQTWPVDYVPLSKEITAVGFIEFNERSQRTVSARVAGRIDKLIANETGQMVTAGDELASLYSPELLVTVQNLLDAKRSGNKDYVANARTRLQLLGIDDPQIEEILSSNTATTHLRIRSPINGHVITKYVREGQYVEEGTPLYDVADLSTVWIQAQIYEDDLAFLPVDLVNDPHAHDWDGLTVTATTRAFPDQPIEGKLTFVYPHVDEETRTVTVRFELDNPGHKLRPGGTATVTLKVNPNDIAALAAVAGEGHGAEMLKEGRMLAVPESAVIDTGNQHIVYREQSPGVYEGTDVKLGPAMAGPGGAIFYPVLRGLSHGNLVVTSGSFLVDAETRLNPAAGSIYFGGSGGSQSGRSSVTTVRPSTPDDPDAQIEAALAKLTPEDRRLAEQQGFCPILTDSRLGGMGTPVKLTLENQTVFVCCSGCKEKALADPKATIATVEKLKTAKRNGTSSTMTAESNPKIAAALASLSEEDRREAEAQRFCAVAQKSPLGSMGTPIKLTIENQSVFLCCDGCRVAALRDPKATLATVAKLKAANKSQE
jgi:Cu(I)/Ag(I) efflux system membrane fusion protein